MSQLHTLVRSYHVALFFALWSKPKRVVASYRWGKLKVANNLGLAYSYAKSWNAGQTYMAINIGIIIQRAYRAAKEGMQDQ